MKKYKKMKMAFLGLFTAFCLISYGADWPQWRGTDRQGKSDETKLLKKWPEEGPKLLWSAEGIGQGHSSISIADGMVYVTGNIDKVEHLTAFDLKGSRKWQKPYGKAWNRSHPPARSCATIDSGKAYVISGMGVMSCFDAKTGEEKWTKDAFTEYDGQYGKWGIAESPLIVDNKVIFTPGGEKATMVALEKDTGEVVWASKSIGDKPAYCSPTAIERGGKTIIITVVAGHIIGVNAADGEILWSYACSQYQPKVKGINTNTPLYHDGEIFVTSGYDMGSVKLEVSDDGTSVKNKWINYDLDTHVGGVVYVDGYVYGTSWDGNKMGNWICVDWKTGETVYDTEWNNKGQIISAEGMLYCYEEKKGNLALVKADPKGFQVVSSFKIDKGKGVHWAHPAISDGVLYVRHEDALMAYDIKE